MKSRGQVQFYGTNMVVGGIILVVTVVLAPYILNLISPSFHAAIAECYSS